MVEIPMWVLFVFGGIVVSAFMAVKSGKEERKQENASIEREGEIYMQRLEKAKEERQDSKKERVLDN